MLDLTIVPKGIPKNKNTMGLFSIRERMTDLGGDMVVKSSKSKGTEVTFTAPLRRT